MSAKNTSVDKSGWNIEWAKGGAVAPPAPIEEIESVEPAAEIEPRPKPKRKRDHK